MVCRNRGRDDDVVCGNTFCVFLKKRYCAIDRIIIFYVFLFYKSANRTHLNCFCMKLNRVVLICYRFIPGSTAKPCARNGKSEIEGQTGGF